MIISSNLVEEITFDVALFGIGYEKRSRFIAENNYVFKKSIAIGYNKNTEFFDYKDNLSFFQSKKSTIYSIDDEHLSYDIQRILSEINFDSKLTVLLDITVMSRSRLSTLINYLFKSLKKGSKLVIKYSISDFVPPPSDFSPVRKIGEISESFIGSIGDPSLPVSLILGLGYEKNKALGVYHYIDTSLTYCLLPEGPIIDFNKSIMENNTELLSLIDKEKQVTYSVSHPYSTYLDTKSLILSLKKDSRPLLIPLGPKIFAAICAILGSELNLPVWRVSSNHQEKPINRVASGEVVTLAFEI